MVYLNFYLPLLGANLVVIGISDQINPKLLSSLAKRNHAVTTLVENFEELETDDMSNKILLQVQKATGKVYIFKGFGLKC